MVEYSYDIVIVGHGAAGLAAAVSAAETILQGDRPLTVAVLERTDSESSGGSTRYTGAFFRVNTDLSPAPSFVGDIMKFSGDRSDREVVDTLHQKAESTLRWVQDHGIEFDAIPTGFLTASRPRTLPVGGGRAIVDTLLKSARRQGVEVLYERTALSLTSVDGGSWALTVRNNRTGHMERLICSAVVLACGGFEGNVPMMTEYMGSSAFSLQNISPGGLSNQGEGIQMAVEVGAKMSGRWDIFHAEPIDPRSHAPEPALMIFPYGILVNKEGNRFIDEASGTVDEIYENVSRTILKEANNEAYFITDKKLYTVPNYQRAIMSPEPPIVAETIGQLAELLGIPVERLRLTIEEFNAAVQDGPYDPLVLDGKRTHGLNPEKSNWAVPIDQPPYLAYPIACSIVFTFGGIETDASARVLSRDAVPIPGLYAAGEITGLYYGKYPGATSVLRGLVFGRIAGNHAVEYVNTVSQGES